MDTDVRFTNPATRRTIVATGAKLAYAAPLVAASFTLSATNAAAVSLGPGDACRKLTPAAVAVGNFEEFRQCMAPAECRNGSQRTIQAGGQQVRLRAVAIAARGPGQARLRGAARCHYFGGPSPWRRNAWMPSRSG